MCRLRPRFVDAIVAPMLVLAANPSEENVHSFVFHDGSGNAPLHQAESDMLKMLTAGIVELRDQPDSSSDSLWVGHVM